MPYDEYAHVADLDLARRDPALPGLSTLLDHEAFSTALSRLLPNSIEDVRPTYVRYKPGMSCLVLYRVTTAGQTVGVYAKAHRADDRAKFTKAIDRGSDLLEHHIVVSLFPHDTKLRSLSRLGSAALRSRLLRRVLSRTPDLWSGDVQQLQYKPERRYVARLDVDEQPVAALKFFTTAAYEAARIGARAFESRSSLRVAKLIGTSNRHRILAYEWLPGSLLSQRLTGDEFSTDDPGRTGVALAELHGQSTEGLPRLSHDLESRRLRQVAESVGCVCPWLAEKADELASRIATEIHDLDDVSMPVHGDFYAKQVLLLDDGIAVLDFDESSLGDPATDFGNFIAHLERDVLRGRITRDRAAATSEALVQGYAGVASLPSDERIRLYAARCLFALVPHPFRVREPNWPHSTKVLLERTEDILDGGGTRLRTVQPSRPPSCRVRPRRNRVPVEDTFGIADDSTMHFLIDALVPTVIEESFQQFTGRLAGDGGSLSLRSIRVLRHKPGRRCLIEYRLDAENSTGHCRTITLIGKARIRSLDSKTYRISKGLWDAGFDDTSADGISTPEPIGCVPELNMWVQRHVPGTPATDRLLGADGARVAGRIARGIHKLNRVGPHTGRLHTMADELRILHEKLPLVGMRHPGWSGRIDRILDGCNRLAESVRDPRFQPIHRDLYPGNLIVDGDRTYILDLDLYAMGDPALDAGNFIGHLTELSIRRTGNSLALRIQEKAFEDSFVSLVGESRRRAVRTYTTLTLARHIYLSTQFETRRATTGLLIELCEDRLNIGRHTSTRLLAANGGLT